MNNYLSPAVSSKLNMFPDFVVINGERFVMERDDDLPDVRFYVHPTYSIVGVGRDWEEIERSFQEAIESARAEYSSIPTEKLSAKAKDLFTWLCLAVDSQIITYHRISYYRSEIHEQPAIFKVRATGTIEQGFPKFKRRPQGVCAIH